MEIKAYFSILIRWLWLIVLGVLVAGGVSYLVSRNTTPVYSTSTRLLIDEAPGGASGNEYSQVLLEQRLALTYVEIIETTPILEETINRLNLDMTTGQLAGKVSISAPTDTQIIQIVVEDTNPSRAAEIANTLVDVFIQKTEERENLRYAGPISNWENRMNAIGDEIEATETEINALVGDETLNPADEARLSRLQTELNEQQIRYTEAFNNLNELQVSQAKESSNVVQIEDARPNVNPIRPRTLTNTLLAAVVGGMVALGIAFLVEYLDDTVKSPDHILEDTGMSTLGHITDIPGDSSFERLITFHTPRDPISEAFRVLRTNLSFSAVDGGLKTMLVTSSSPGEGKSNTAANLAVVIAQTGKRVLVVDADLRRPTQHKVFELPNNQGLTTAVVDSQTPLQHHIQKTAISQLFVMTSGPIPPNPSELLNSQRMHQVCETLSETFDLIIFDTPPVLTVADATILSTMVNGVLIIVDAGNTRRGALHDAWDRLQQSNAPVFGVVLNRLKKSRGGYYYYHYYEAYEEETRHQRSRKRPAWLTSWLPNFNKN